MRPQISRVSEDFWNIRGSFKIGGVVEIGTQASLVRRARGTFVLLDSCSLNESVENEVRRLTDGGRNIEAILNLHPFHTVYAQEAHERFPNARLYGTARHLSRFPDLPWEPQRTEDPALHGMFAEDFEFSVPRGVDFISSNENIHFSSVLVFHPASKTVHVDDTLMYIRFPSPLRLLGIADSLSFHPTLSRALERRAGAARDFRDWAEELAERWRDSENLCAAHVAALTAEANSGSSIHARIMDALDKVQGKLTTHERRYG
jgi:hypothetical protein